MSIVPTLDPRPFERDQVLTAQEMNDTWRSILEIYLALVERHNADGTRFGRDAPAYSATYVWDGVSQYDLAGGRGPWPATITPGATGQWTIVLSGSGTGTTDYDVQLTGGLTTDARPAVLGWDPLTSDATNIVVRACDAGNNYVNPTAFSIQVAFGT